MLIEKMTADHYEEVLKMMRVFYDSPAVLHTSSDNVLRNDIDACIGDCPYLDGYVFIEEGESLFIKILYFILEKE